MNEGRRVAEVAIPASHGDMDAYVAMPPGAGPFPGVVVLHDALGMSSDLRSQADWLAGEGYLAVAPNLYYWGKRFACLRTTMRDAMRGEGGTFSDLEAARTWLESHQQCTGNIGVIGFCMGGGFAVLLAPRPGWSVASVNYGGLPNDLESFLAGACPIVGSYGGRDVTLRSAPGRLESRLTRLNVAHDIKAYDDAGHAFMNDHTDDEVQRILVVLGWLSRSEHHPEAAADSRRRIVDFFSHHLS